MNLSVSNLAWDNNETEKVLQTLQKYNIGNIEGVLTKISGWGSLLKMDLSYYQKSLSQHKISMTSIQSIFYNTKINSLSDQNLVLGHLDLLVKLSKKFGYKTLVFGSPSIRNNISEKDLSELFVKMDSILDKENLTLCIEPNTKKYKGEFFFTVGEIVNFIKINNLKNIKTMIDTHNVILEGEDPIDVLKKYFEYIHHVHISEDGLLPLSDIEFHKKFSSSLSELHYEGLLVYELLPCKDFGDQVKLFVSLYSNINSL